MATTIEELLRAYSSAKPAVELRAAKLLVKSADTPLATLLDILDRHSRKGLGATTEKVLLRRTDSDLYPAMIERLASSDHFVREVACRVLGELSDKAAVESLMNMLDDPSMMVRRAAAFALGRLGDERVLTDLRRQRELHDSEDVNVLMAIDRAIRSLEPLKAAEREP